MSTARRISARHLVGVFAVAAVLAGCSGSPGALSPIGTGSTQNAALRQTPATPQAIVEPDACRNHGAVRVTPCHVVFTASQKGPISIDLRTPNGKKGSVVEHDNCGGASGIAVISGSGNSWSVSAGNATGHCHVRFNYFNNNQVVGWAVLKVRNSN